MTKKPNLGFGIDVFIEALYELVSFWTDELADSYELTQGSTLILGNQPLFSTYEDGSLAYDEAILDVHITLKPIERGTLALYNEPSVTTHIDRTSNIFHITIIPPRRSDWDAFIDLHIRNDEDECSQKMRDLIFEAVLKEISLMRVVARSNPTFWGAAAAGILFTCEEDDTYCLLLRSEYVMEPYTWGIPGGSVQGEGFYNSDKASTSLPNYAFWEGAKVETQEECGSLPKGLKRPSGRNVIDYVSGNFVYRNFVCNLTFEEKDRWTHSIELNWESVDVGWFSREELRSLDLHFGVRYLLQELGVLVN